jgi:hypothetical protein
MWDLWRTKWHWDRFFSEFFGFPLSISFHRRSPYSYIIWGMNSMSVSGSSSETYSHPIKISVLGKSPQARRLGGPQSLFGYAGEEKNISLS